MEQPARRRIKPLQMKTHARALHGSRLPAEGGGKPPQSKCWRSAARQSLNELAFTPEHAMLATMGKGRRLGIVAIFLVLLAVLGWWGFNSGEDDAAAEPGRPQGSDASSDAASEGGDDPSSMKPSKLPREPAEPSAHDFIRQKMEKTIIPIIDFEDTSIEEAIDFLRLRSRELDPEEDPAMKGISFVIRKPKADDAALDSDGAGGLGVGGDPGALQIRELRMTNVSLWDALHRIADESGLRVEITEYAIELAPK